GKDQSSGGGHADTMSWRWQGRTSANRSLSSRFSPYARAAASPPATSPTRRRRRGDGDGVRRSTAKTPAARERATRASRAACDSKERHPISGSPAARSYSRTLHPGAVTLSSSSAGPAQGTTLTILPGTTMTFLGSAPARFSWTFASARATASTSAGEASAGTVTRERTLPLICTGYSTESSTRYDSSYSGNGPWARESVCPRRDHSSSARCGATGAAMSTSGSATDRGAPGPAVGYALVRVLTNSMSLAIAVLSRRAA